MYDWIAILNSIRWLKYKDSIIGLNSIIAIISLNNCLLYTSDAADE